mmetsp:Transcript_63324/g.93958  ORF Transcript_63324/g.93958 Transcript_63324/m.93958 type:complete len:351 (-) Transcript_63324:123-1175(-)
MRRMKRRYDALFVFVLLSMIGYLNAFAFTSLHSSSWKISSSSLSSPATNAKSIRSSPHRYYAQQRQRASATPTKLSASNQFLPLDTILKHSRTLSKPLLAALSTLSQAIKKELTTLSTNQKLLCTSFFLLGYTLGNIQNKTYTKFWKRFTSVLDIPPTYFGPNAPVFVGTVASVSDGDTIRFLHRPTMFHPKELNKSKGEKLSDTALPIRLCTIDAPETAKFGKPGQPFGIEAKERLQQLLTGSTTKKNNKNQKVYLRLLHKDQYGRAVAQVYKRKPLWFVFPKKKQNIYMDEQMLKEGLAEVYVGAGAVYGPLGKEEYIKLEEDARKQRIGIWSLKKRESAAEFKKRSK